MCCSCARATTASTEICRQKQNLGLIFTRCSPLPLRAMFFSLFRSYKHIHILMDRPFAFMVMLVCVIPTVLRRTKECSSTTGQIISTMQMTSVSISLIYKLIINPPHMRSEGYGTLLSVSLSVCLSVCLSLCLAVSS